MDVSSLAASFTTMQAGSLQQQIATQVTKQNIESEKQVLQLLQPAAVAPGPLVGHCSGATGLEPLAPHEAFSLHPLMTVTGTGANFNGATAAIDGSSERATELAD